MGQDSKFHSVDECFFYFYISIYIYLYLYLSIYLFVQKSNEAKQNVLVLH